MVSRDRLRCPAVNATLVRHFLAQFASFEAVSPSGQVRRAVIAIVSLMAAPGYLMAVVTARSARRAVLAHPGQLRPELWLWAQEWTLFTVSLAAITVLVAVQWESLVLGRRDYRILGVLPLARRTVTVAKLASLAAIVLLLHAAVNTLPGIILPIASPLGYLRPLLALQLGLLLQTVFVCAAVVALQGLMGLALPKRLLARGSSLLQFVILLCAVFFFLWSAPLSRFAYSVRDSIHPLNTLLPVVWFRAFYLRLAGVESPELTWQALQAVLATFAAAAIAVPCCLIGYRDDGAPEKDSRTLLAWPRLRRLRYRLPQPRPVVAGVASFVERALAGNSTVTLIARGWFAVGIALTLGGVGALALRELGRDAPRVPTSPLHAPAILLPFFALVGVRLSAVFPASLEANWIFRMTETPGSVDYAAGVRKAAMRIAVWPLLGVLAAGYTILWGPWRALALVVLAGAIARVTAGWLFLGFAKVPFTCTYQPGKANLRASWPMYAAIFLVYCAVLPALTERLLGSPRAYAVALLLLLAAREALVRLDRRTVARGGSLCFEDCAPATVTALDLES